MVRSGDVHSLTDFQRNAKSHLRRLKKTGHPTLLTVNGKGSVVVIDAKKYDELIDLLNASSLQEGLAQAARGEGIPLETFDRRMRRKHKLAPRNRS